MNADYDAVSRVHRLRRPEGRVRNKRRNTAIRSKINVLCRNCMKVKDVRERADS